MKTLLLAAACLMLAGCQQSIPGPGTQERHFTYKTSGYWQDPKTDVCFAIVEAYYGGNYVETSTTVVPCNEKVLAYVKMYPND